MLVRSKSPWQHYAQGYAVLLLIAQTCLRGKAGNFPPARPTELCQRSSVAEVRARGNQERLQGLIHHAEGCSKPAQPTVTSSPFHSYKETVPMAPFGTNTGSGHTLDATEFGKEVWQHSCAQGPSSTYRRREEIRAVLSETLKATFTRDRAQQK